jgi:hypothetical protein
MAPSHHYTDTGGTMAFRIDGSIDRGRSKKSPAPALTRAPALHRTPYVPIPLLQANSTCTQLLLQHYHCNNLYSIHGEFTVRTEIRELRVLRFGWSLSCGWGGVERTLPSPHILKATADRKLEPDRNLPAALPYPASAPSSLHARASAWHRAEKAENTKGEAARRSK